MRFLSHLFENNRVWAQRIKAKDPDFFLNLSSKQSPAYLWIGCSDSRVPATQIIGLMPGELFVHRNVANVIANTDLNALSVLHYAVDQLKVKHIIVCGHYGCSGVRAALKNDALGLIDNWLIHIKIVNQKHEARLAGMKDESRKSDRLCELNVIEQVMNVCQTSIVQEAWKRKQELAAHGWIYGIQDGLLRDLNICISTADEVGSAYNNALLRLS